MNFVHSYYSIDENSKETVLCMKCAFPVKKPGYTKEQVREYYKEVKVKWAYGNGISADGVVITCPECLDFVLDDDNRVKIKTQVIDALELQMKKVKKDPKEIEYLKNLFNQMTLTGRA